MINILGIETSCDDSSASVVSDGLVIRSDVVASQDVYHQKFGGIVPEIAARKHLEHILPVIEHSLAEADLTFRDIDGIAVTHRPGLTGSLIVGLTAAKCLAYLYNKPLLGIHHIEAHAYAASLAGMPYGTPHIALVASGGHTSLLRANDDASIDLIGTTVDDAAGEAFDKVSKLLGFGYPGGPIIDKLAQESPESAIEFPRPMIKSADFNFSFSGLKTAVMYHVKHYPDTPPAVIAKCFQDAVIDVLVKKTILAAKKLGINTISVVGGVAANQGLRARFQEICTNNHLHLFIPKPRLCTDNAAMVAGLAFHKYKKRQFDSLDLGVESHSGWVLRTTP